MEPKILTGHQKQHSPRLRSSARRDISVLDPALVWRNLWPMAAVPLTSSDKLPGASVPSSAEVPVESWCDDVLFIQTKSSKYCRALDSSCGSRPVMSPGLRKRVQLPAASGLFYFKQRVNGRSCFWGIKPDHRQWHRLVIYVNSSGSV